MGILRTTLFSITLVALPLATHAQRTDATSVGMGRIIGTVLDAETELPIEGVVVALRDMNRTPQTTDRFGRFIFDRLEGAVYLLDIQHIRYGRGGYLINVPHGETAEFRASLRPSAILLDCW